MSTSELPSGPALSGPVDPTGLRADIERLANQLFQSQPGETTQAAPAVLAAGGTPPAPSSAVSPAPPTEPSFAELSAVLAGLPTELVPSHALAGSSETPSDPYFMGLAGGVPTPTAGIPASNLGAAPSFSAPATHGPAVESTSAEGASPTAEDPTPRVASTSEIHPEVVPSLDLRTDIFDPHIIKRDFPILRERVRGRPLVWLDNAATTQKPQSVIDRLSYFYEHENSNVHRAAHTLAARATDAYEGARDKVRRFLNAPSSREIVFVRGATEGINLIAKSWGRRNVGRGDEVLITWLEHHANIVPWQQLCSETGACLKVAPVDSTGQVILEELEKLVGPKTRIVSFTQVSNALGTVVPAREIVDIAHRHGARVLIDGAQAVSHMAVDVAALDCDFYVFSGHKVFAPTGIGAVFGKPEVLSAMPPWQGGGNMIADVTFEKTTYQPPPSRFEAGTGNIADAVGLGAAIDYVTELGLPNIERYEHELRTYGEERLSEIRGLRIIGTAREKAGVISFVLDGIRTEDVGAALDQEGIAVRSGHHCAQPILRRFGVEATVRASLAPYNTHEDLDALVAAVRRLQLGRTPR